MFGKERKKKMKLSKENRRQYRSTLQLIWEYVQKSEHNESEKMLFLVVIIHLLQTQDIPLVRFIDLWEQQNNLPPHIKNMPFFSTIETEKEFKEPISTRKTEPLQPPN